MDYITISMCAIITIALFVIFISFWITDLADQDAQSINISGSMRMQTYHIGLALEENNRVNANKYIEKLHQTWNNPLFTGLHKDNNNLLSQRFNNAYKYWLLTVRPALKQQIESNHPIVTPITLLEHQVELTDQLVNEFQKHAESKIRQLRTFQLVAFFTTIIVGSLIYSQLKSRIERPLKQLTETSKPIGEGDFNQKTNISGNDELALLGAVFNQMIDSLADMYSDLETRVKERTQELEKNNTTLQYLFNNAKRILNSHESPLDYEELLSELDKIINVGNIDLCLFTAEGQKPYLHTTAEDKAIKDCSEKNCNNCLNVDIETAEDNLKFNHHFTIEHNDCKFGVITVTNDHLDHWQRKLLKSTADQMAIAISLSEQKSQEQRLAMLSERTVIARELHDSLAQALSYLQIQVTLLEKTQQKEKFDKQPPIINELKEGLSSAYRQLRELLSTFRLQIDSGGLKTALQASVEDLNNRSEMQVSLKYGLSDIPLSSAEEIHLLQIVREAGQNAIHHSHGSKVNISLQQLDDDSIELQITNDGISIPDKPERINHYGLAIMKERSRHLGGDIVISPLESGGTIVAFNFMPTCLRENIT